MGNTISRKSDSGLQTQLDTPQNYKESYTLLLDLIATREKRLFLLQLKGEEAQVMVDFLDLTLQGLESKELVSRKDILHTLASLTRIAQVFPDRLKLRDEDCEFDSQSPRHHGAFGDVYEGTFSGQNVCIKAIRTGPSSDTREELLKMRYTEEAILLAHMLHLNILPLRGIYFPSREPHNVYIISPWMNNGDLSSYLSSYPKEHPNQVDLHRLLIMSDIISGLAYMHQLDIIHSDLRARNVLISEEGRALLVGFGTPHISAIGTSANWTAPELLLGHRVSASWESDIWSYACTCFEILTGGEKPFSQFPNTVLLNKALQNPNTTLNRPSGTVDDRVWKKLNRCLSREPKKRPTARNIVNFFAELELQDDRPPAPAYISRTGPDFNRFSSLVYPILQNMQSAINSSTVDREREK